MPAIPGMIRVMAAAPRVYLADPQNNAQEIAALVHIADERGAQLCVFPELSLTGATCGDLFFQPALQNEALDALKTLIELPVNTAFVVGLPLCIEGRLFNCAAVVSQGDVVFVPQTHVSRDMSRWFHSGAAAPSSVVLWGRHIPVCKEHVLSLGAFSLGVELGEDALAPIAPSALLAPRGATIIANPSAQSEIVTGHPKRVQRLRHLSAQGLCGYVHAGAGFGESTTDAVYAGYAGIYETGKLLAENERFHFGASYALADIDVERLQFKRSQSRTLYAGLSAGECAVPLKAPVCPAERDRLLRPLADLPFVPQGEELVARMRDILLIQAQGLISRLAHIGTQKLVLGVSGGLDSTLALLVSAYAFDRMHWDRAGIIGITMPGLGTGSRTKSNAMMLMKRIGCTTLTIPIGPAVAQHFADIGQDPEVHDICYENSQARERTQIVMDYANKVGALALGTGDLSELVLGWCTYGGDQMSMYNPNGSLPKTLMRALVRYAAEQLGEDIVPIAQDILDTPISPELIPSKEGELNQRTEDKLGAYALHDFFIYHTMDSGASPAKLYALALQAFDGQYGQAAILNALTTFVRRFFTQQFKRSCMPDGAAIGSISLSPRGGLSMPSDAKMNAWLREVEALKNA